LGERERSIEKTWEAVYGTVEKSVNLTNEQRGIGDVVVGKEASF